MRPPRSTILTLFSAVTCQYNLTGRKSRRFPNVLLTARLPRAALAALWTSVSLFCRRKRMGSRVSRPTSRTSGDCEWEGLSVAWLSSPRSVISANVKLALR
jgi:hypothetical protein